MHQLSWEARAAAKRAATLAKIPPQWRLAPEDLERASEQRDLTGSFINGLLDKQTVSITSLDSLPILESISSGRLSATEVTTAFCKTAAVAHQIVRPSMFQLPPRD
jgi:amidase